MPGALLAITAIYMTLKNEPLILRQPQRNEKGNSFTY
jgi:hypothetical protein